MYALNLGFRQWFEGSARQGECHRWIFRAKKSGL